MASFFIDGNGKRYSLGVAQVTINDRIYVRPTASTYIDAGLTEVVIGTRPDDRFYIVTGPDNTGTYSSTPREIDDVTTDGETTLGLKSQFIAKQKDSANKLLSPTDWYVTRKIEIGTEVPVAIATFRTAVRAVCDGNGILISDVADTTALEALMNAPAKVQETLDDENSVFIDNSEPHLSNYPEAPVL